MTAYIPAAKREDWRTPPEPLELVRRVFGGAIALDPCASPSASDWFADVNHSGPAGCRTDGLGQRWRGTVFVNPRFSELAAWAEKCAKEHREQGAEIILLMPARTDTRAWHDHVSTASAVCLWRGRLRFMEATAACPFPVAFVYWGPNVQRFRAVFGAKGMVFQP